MTTLQGYARGRNATRWLMLVALSAALTLLLSLIRLPAAFFLGPMAAAVILGANGLPVRVPSVFLTGAQAIMGCFMASAITPGILRSFIQDWPLFVSVTLAILAAAGLLGWMMTKSGTLPATTSIWGSWPGGAAAMVIMAAEFGADARLVAFMQYLRVACVAGVASAIAAFAVQDHASTPAYSVVWLTSSEWFSFALTLLLVCAGILAGRVLGLSSGPMICCLLAGAALHVSGLIQIELPGPLLYAVYALLGWSVGLHFTPAILRHALKVLPKVMLNVALLIAFSAAIGYLLTLTLGMDALTAYLATSPGGMDSVAIIASSTNVDLPFVMALQTVRLLVVVLVGPAVARSLARRVELQAGR